MTYLNNDPENDEMDEQDEEGYEGFNDWYYEKIQNDEADFMSIEDLKAQFLSEQL